VFVCAKTTSPRSRHKSVRELPKPPASGSVSLDRDMHDLLAVFVEASELVEILALVCERRAPHLKAAELLRYGGRNACAEGLRHYGVTVDRLRVRDAHDEVHEP
jgi:hypothetical protein